mmetsp:Transcript_10805/g.24505  ORF Transcript_10805/g.24505 Transcript_10805/m.24505 type:complete len:105 (+) Transcript_10805:3-317(+)
MPDNDDLVAAAGACAPFAFMLYAHQRGWTAKGFGSVYKRFGVWGLFALPFVTLSMEKCVYDTVLSFRGKDPNARPEGRVQSFPSGGSSLPSFSLIPVRKLDMAE